MTVIPTLPFGDLEIALTVMSASIASIYILVVLAMNLLGLYLADKEIDKAKAIAEPGGKGYDFEWHELAPYAIASGIFTLAILEASKVSLWFSLFLAIVMGMIFRPMLPEIVKAATAKTKLILQAMFGKYE